MYDSGKVLTGLGVFVFLATFAIWYNIANGKGHTPEPKKPEGMKQCVKDTTYMRESHMALLNQWRDEVVRTGNRQTMEIEGKTYEKSLQNGCMSCHKNKTKFCDECHTYAAVDPYCWDCHIQPKETN